MPRSYLSSLSRARKLVGKEVVFSTLVDNSAHGERDQVVVGQVLDVYKNKYGQLGLKVFNFKRTSQAWSGETFVNTNVDADGRAIRNYRAHNIKRLIKVV